ncbi:MAG: TldD/PmbA family protein [Promethearchaeota archaeon]
MIDKLEKSLDIGSKLGATYLELRSEEYKIFSLRLEDMRIASKSWKFKSGIAIRALVEGAWGFVSVTTKEDLDKGVRDAASLARTAAKKRKERISLSSVKAYEDKIDLKIRENPVDISVEKKVHRLQDLEKEVKSKEPRINAVTTSYGDKLGRKYLVTSEGTRIELPIYSIYNLLFVSGKEQDRLTSMGDAIGSSSIGWELFKEETNEKIVTRIVNKLRGQLEGEKPKRGTFPCVLGPSVVGTVAHEALGHGCEADLTINSPFFNRLGMQIGPEEPTINLVDNGKLLNGVGSAKYDDEGVPTTKTYIIKDGLLNGFLTNREYAEKMDLPLSGSARAEFFKQQPLIRMRNTYFDGGDMDHDELLEDIDFGYYCVTGPGGQAQLNTAFQVGIQEAFEINQGEIGDPVTTMAISGIAIDALGKITGVGKKSQIKFDFSSCGKGQYVIVSAGGPYIRFSEGAIVFGGME